MTVTIFKCSTTLFFFFYVHIYEKKISTVVKRSLSVRFRQLFFLTNETATPTKRDWAMQIKKKKKNDSKKREKLGTNTGEKLGIMNTRRKIYLGKKFMRTRKTIHSLAVQNVQTSDR